MNKALIEQFKDCYQNLNLADLSHLTDIYANDVVFKDPVHEIRGLVGLEDYLAALCADLSHCHFEYLDEVISENSAYIKWVMHFKHPKLGDKLISVRGISHLQFSEKVYFHEDLYDMGAMLYEQLPVLGSVTRWLKTRLAS
jgi:hypothetical protein